VPKVLYEDPGTISSLIMLTDHKQLLRCSCYAMHNALATMFPCLGILQHYVEFSTKLS